MTMTIVGSIAVADTTIVSAETTTTGMIVKMRDTGDGKKEDISSIAISTGFLTGTSLNTGDGSTHTAMMTTEIETTAKMVTF